MTDQLTDEYLAKRAEAESLKTYCIDNAISKALVGLSLQPTVDNVRAKAWAKARFADLKVHRDGLKVIEGLRHAAECVYGREIMAGCDIGVETDCCSCGRDKHIASLRELLFNSPP